MKVLHHRCGYALRKFGQTLPEEAILLRPHFRAISHAISRFRWDNDEPNVKWPRWRAKRRGTGKVDRPQTEQPLSLECRPERGDGYAGKWKPMPKLSVVPAPVPELEPSSRSTCLLPRGAARSLKAQPSDESTMAPTDTSADNKSIRRPGRRAKSRARLHDYYMSVHHFGREAGVGATMPFEALCAILEDAPQDLVGDGYDSERRPAKDADSSDSDVEAPIDWRATLPMGVQADGGGGSSAQQPTSPMPIRSRGSHCFSEDASFCSDEDGAGQGSDVVSPAVSEPCFDVQDRRYVQRNPPIPKVGDEVWQAIPQGAINIIQQLNYYEPFAEKPQEASADLLVLVLEAMVGRLQEPCRTPGIGDCGRAWDTRVGSELACTLLGNLMDDGAFASSFSEFRGKLEALGKLADRVSEDRIAPPQMIAYAPVLQRLQICVQRSFAWRREFPRQSGEDPGIVDIIHERSAPSGSMPGRISHPVTELSPSDLQSLLHARLQASRRPCA